MKPFLAHRINPGAFQELFFLGVQEYRSAGVQTIVLGTRPPGGMGNALQEEIVNAIVL